MAGSQKTKPTQANVVAFLEAVPDETRRADALALCGLLADITGEPPVMWGSSIIGFGAYCYRYPSGHEGTSALASFAPRANHLVIYLIGGFEDKDKHLLQRLGSHKAGKGCLYLKRLADVDLDVLKDLIRRSIEVRRGMDQSAVR